jgi:hypothetical protein
MKALTQTAMFWLFVFVLAAVVAAFFLIQLAGIDLTKTFPV